MRYECLLHFKAKESFSSRHDKNHIQPKQDWHHLSRSFCKGSRARNELELQRSYYPMTKIKQQEKIEKKEGGEREKERERERERERDPQSIKTEEKNKKKAQEKKKRMEALTFQKRFTSLHDVHTCKIKAVSFF